MLAQLPNKKPRFFRGLVGDRPHSFRYRHTSIAMDTSQSDMAGCFTAVNTSQSDMAGCIIAMDTGQSDKAGCFTAVNTGLSDKAGC